MRENDLQEIHITTTKNLIKQLDETGNSLTLSAWYYDCESDEWFLLLSFSRVVQRMSVQSVFTHQIVREVITKTPLSNLDMSQIKIIEPSSSLAKILLSLVKMPALAIHRAEFRNISINEVFIKRVIILRTA